ncbi:hypothetical protein VNO77_20033 [Canavalia gladiata]|uniref:Uncharacterized protein n=1 Tax=Canavalia gladiata TaxID=3824 RepID=A0AAN9LNK2_CANGL
MVTRYYALPWRLRPITMHLNYGDGAKKEVTEEKSKVEGTKEVERTMAALVYLKLSQVQSIRCMEALREHHVPKRMWGLVVGALARILNDPSSNPRSSNSVFHFSIYAPISFLALDLVMGPTDPMDLPEKTFTLVLPVGISASHRLFFLGWDILDILDQICWCS